MPKVVRNAAGEPFSKWQPAAKFAWRFSQPEPVQYPLLWLHVTKEYQFDEHRKWRFDYAWPQEKVAVEIDGFGYGHQAQQHIAANNEKRNQAVLFGWRVLVFDSRLLGSKQAVEDAVELTAKVLCCYGQYQRGYEE